MSLDMSSECLSIWKVQLVASRTNQIRDVVVKFHVIPKCFETLNILVTSLAFPKLSFDPLLHTWY
eukprot:05821.XXX_73058_73252_1 [CDS] Oithona nana genome sequencing.